MLSSMNFITALMTIADIAIGKTDKFRSLAACRHFFSTSWVRPKM